MSSDQLKTTAFDMPEPRAVRVPTGQACDACTVGECHRCVRAGCYHRHDSDVRSHGCIGSSDGAEHGAPGPGGRR